MKDHNINELYSTKNETVDLLSEITIFTFILIFHTYKVARLHITKNWYYPDTMFECIQRSFHGVRNSSLTLLLAITSIVRPIMFPPTPTQLKSHLAEELFPNDGMYSATNKNSLSLTNTFYQIEHSHSSSLQWPWSRDKCQFIRWNRGTIYILVNETFKAKNSYVVVQC